MESAGKSAADGLDIALHLVDMLPSIPLHLTFNKAIADLPGFTPKALTYASPPLTSQGAMATPGKETLVCACGAKDQVASHMAYDGDRHRVCEASSEPKGRSQ